ncbi:hypothetical protein M422DRAFT_24617 [Sphaerobolus stellatus SS14]|nr:hypothetical protein M422DRAFT_24617 [Sphaerobolus stellatus SS14]
MHAGVSLPTELIMNIMEVFFEDSAACSSQVSSLEAKPPWSRVKNVLTASHTLRAIGLRLWFVRLRVKSEWNWDYISRIPGIYQWVREISYHHVAAILIPSIQPENFPSLKSVSIRMLSIPRPLSVIERLPPSVRRLEIWKFDTMIHDHLFSAIAAKLPHLQDLRLHGMGEFDKFGIGTLFDSADNLGRSIALSLNPLQSLRSLSIDVYLTPASILLRHASCPIEQKLQTCPNCLADYGEITGKNERDVSLLIAHSLANLDTIEWCSSFSSRGKSMLHVKRTQGQQANVTVAKEDIYWADSETSVSKFA